jgi:hypothetical protein
VLTGSCARLGDEMERTLAADAGAIDQIPHFLHWYLAESGPVLPVLARLLDHLVAHVGAGRDGGVFRASVNPTAVASLLLGVTLFNSQTEHLRRHMRPRREVGDDAYAELLTEVLLHGVWSSHAAQTA